MVKILSNGLPSERGYHRMLKIKKKTFLPFLASQRGVAPTLFIENPST
jgi:hypothetical protein